jgi:Xaa-Pro aminopeptidase
VPEAVLVIDTDSQQSTLLLPKKNSYQNEWDGEHDTDKFQKTSGITEYCTSSELVQLIKKAVNMGKKIGYLAPAKNRVEPYGFYANPARNLLKSKLKRYAVSDVELHDVRLDIARLRQIKQPVELDAIKSAIKATELTLNSVRSRLDSFATEKDIERAITAGFYENGGDGHSFEPIVAAGKNAATIHYTGNSDSLLASNIVLIDVGIRMNNYSSDISRMWQLKKMTARQKQIYEAVLGLQQELISSLKPGVKLGEFNRSVQKKVINLMSELGVKNPKKRPQGFGHFLGIDTHDSADYMKPLEPGAVLTVEPGIYLVDEGIGVRIEDDILITENGSENLSEAIPKLL